MEGVAIHQSFSVGKISAATMTGAMASAYWNKAGPLCSRQTYREKLSKIYKTPKLIPHRPYLHLTAAQRNEIIALDTN